MYKICWIAIVNLEFQIPQGQSSNDFLYSTPRYLKVSNPIGTKFKLFHNRIPPGPLVRFKSHRDKVQIFRFIESLPESKQFQIPQGQSSNYFKQDLEATILAFQIPQGQSSNFVSIMTEFHKNTCFKSHRDKVQILSISVKAKYILLFQIPQGQSSNKVEGIGYYNFKAFQIPQGQSSNYPLTMIIASLTSFKSHRDKVQIYYVYNCLGISLVSNPIGTKFKCTLDFLQATLRKSFKSHRDKVQILVLISVLLHQLAVSNPIGTKFKSKKSLELLSISLFQIPQGQSSNC